MREKRPVYVDLLPPCNSGCPAGENIQAWLGLVKAGDHEAAWRALTADNPFAAIPGRVCYHPCATVCNRADAHGAAATHQGERAPRAQADPAGGAVRARRDSSGGAGAGHGEVEQVGTRKAQTVVVPVAPGRCEDCRRISSHVGRLGDRHRRIPARAWSHHHR